MIYDLFGYLTLGGFVCVRTYWSLTTMFREYIGADKPCVLGRPRLGAAAGAQRRAGAQGIRAGGAAAPAGTVAGAAAAVMVVVRVRVMVVVVIAAGAAAQAAALLDLLGAHLERGGVSLFVSCLCVCGGGLCFCRVFVCLLSLRLGAKRFRGGWVLVSSGGTHWLVGSLPQTKMRLLLLRLVLGTATNNGPDAHHHRRRSNARSLIRNQVGI